MKNSIYLALISGVLVFTSCGRDNENIVEELVPAGDVKAFTDLDASANGKWTYFSFEKGSVVEVEKPEMDLSWDIAFNRYHIRTNSGESGKGKSGVAKVQGIDFNAITKIPENITYTADAKETVPAGPRGMVDMVRNAVISGYVAPDGNAPADVSVVSGWAYYAGGGKIVPTNNVYIVRDASGNPYKIQLTSYTHSQKTTSGFISFQYKKAGSNNQF